MHQRISRLLFSVALTLAISAACQLLAIESGPIARLSATPLYSGRTQDPTAVQLTMQDKDEVIRFKIPRMYMTLSPNWKGGMQDVIAIEVVFPSMAPAGRKASRRQTFCRSVSILLRVPTVASAFFAYCSITKIMSGLESIG
jgi:hypothetical protein